MTFEESRNIIAKDGFARYIVVKSESETPKYPSWNPMPCQSKAFAEAVRYLCLSGYEVLRDSEIYEYDKKHGFMTLDEAKKILEKEGYSLGAQGKPGVVSGAFLKYESPEIFEAMQTVCSAGFEIMMFGNVFEARKKRLKKEYEKNTKAPGSAENSIKGDLSGNESIEHCGEPIPGSPLSAAEGIKLKRKDNRNTSENPALKESASQFNDTLLDEQAKKIEELTMENERLKDQVAVLYACKENNEKYNLKQIKRLGKEISKLNGIIHDKNEEIKRKTKGCCELVAESVDLKEVLRKTESLLNDTREANSRNLDTCFKNEDLIDDLKKKLAEKTKLAKKYAKELSDSSLGLCKLEKQLLLFGEVIIKSDK